jgi:hypothetical protein
MKTAKSGTRTGRKNRDAGHRAFPEKTTGFIEENAACLKAGEGEGRRDEPEPAAWMTPTVINRTHEVWSKEYGRSLERWEVLEILRNVRWFGEILRRWMRGELTT